MLYIFFCENLFTSLTAQSQILFLEVGTICLVVKGLFEVPDSVFWVQEVRVRLQGFSPD